MSGDLAAKSCGYTQISVQKFCYEWTISNFSFCMGGIQKKITGPVFSLEAHDEVSWCLRVHPNGVDEESKDHLSVYLVLLSCPESPVWATFKFWIINSQGEEYQNMKSPNILSFLQYQHRGLKMFVVGDFFFSHQPCLLPEDQLTICCKVSIVGAFFIIPGHNMTPAIKDPRHVLTDDLGELWKNSLFTDCSLVVAGHEFRAHKAILAAHSPVFRIMFEHEMKERLTNCVEIHNLDPQVFKAMMAFIYTRKVPHLQSHFMGAGLLAAADMYGLEHLMVVCEDALCRKLSVKNAVHIFILADLHSTGQLKAQALDFIALHASEASETLGWKSMGESQPHLAEALHSLASAQCVFLEPALKCLK